MEELLVPQPGYNASGCSAFDMWLHAHLYSSVGHFNMP